MKHLESTGRPCRHSGRNRRSGVGLRRRVADRGRRPRGGPPTADSEGRGQAPPTGLRRPAATPAALRKGACVTDVVRTVVLPRTPGADGPRPTPGSVGAGARATQPRQHRPAAGGTDGGRARGRGGPRRPRRATGSDHGRRATAPTTVTTRTSTRTTSTRSPRGPGEPPGVSRAGRCRASPRRGSDPPVAGAVPPPGCRRTRGAVRRAMSRPRPVLPGPAPGAAGPRHPARRRRPSSRTP